jgi:hypothetical protein
MTCPWEDDPNHSLWAYDRLGWWVRFGPLSPSYQVTLLDRLQYEYAQLEAQRPPSGIEDSALHLKLQDLRRWLRLLRHRRAKERALVRCEICGGRCQTARHKARTKDARVQPETGWRRRQVPGTVKEWLTESMERRQTP